MTGHRFQAHALCSAMLKTLVAVCCVGFNGLWTLFKRCHLFLQHCSCASLQGAICQYVVHMFVALLESGEDD